ncbi:MAG: putative metal-binding motif-containing protein, partial [Saprospiraceae bacterium]
MKKIFLLPLFLACSVLASAQSYFVFPSPGWKQGLLQTVWNGHIFDNTLVEAKYAHDTIIDGLPYTVTQLGGDQFTRQQGGKLYHLQITGNGNVEKLLYDFSAEVGDTIQNDFYSQGNYVLTVIKKEKIGNPTQDSLWYLEIRRAGFVPDTIKWLEGVGDLQAGLFQFAFPDGGLAHICTLNKLNQTIRSNNPTVYSANPIQQNWNCDYIYGQDLDNDGFRNHIPQSNTLELNNGIYPPLYITSAIHRECDTLVIVNKTGFSVYTQDGGNLQLVAPDLITGPGPQDQKLFFYNLQGIKKLIVSHQISDVYYIIDILGCTTQDCDDQNAAINSGQVEVPYNGIDDDCNPATLDDDLDQDGFVYTVDCDDQNAAVNPSQVEITYNGLDDDCDPLSLDDDLDQDGFALAEDCD